MAILGELDRAGLLNSQTRTVLGLSMQEQLAQYDIMQTEDEAVLKFFRAGPAVFVRLQNLLARLSLGS
ncbi:hypothetical protein OK016_09065 [Vibrio chagasii]|nr:hypothetical protein [Vibrio chagasii]